MENFQTDVKTPGMTRPISYYGKLGGWVSIAINMFLFLLKGGLGLFTGSLALIADAFHTLSDVATSVVVVISFYITGKPSDTEHPFGHGRAEFISAIIMSTLLAVTAFELLKSSFHRIMNPVAFVASWWVILVILATVLVKEGIAFYAMHLSRKINSDTLRADSWHHHLDAVSSMMVVIAFIFSHFQYPYLDGPVGVIIALIIFYSAYGIVKSPIDHLLGTPPSENLLNKIEATVLSFPQIKGVHDIIIHNYGYRTILSLHIEIDEELSLIDAHQISEKVDRTLRSQTDAYVTVHMDPVMERTPFYRKVEDKIREFCHQNPDCDSFHDLRVYGSRDRAKLLFDLVAAPELPEGSEKKLVKDCQEFVKKNIPEVGHVTVKVEPKFSITRKSRHN